MASAAVIAMLLALYISGSLALQCYKCSEAGTSCSTNSRTCSPGQDQCLKVVVKVDGKKGVAADCTTKAVCKVKSLACAIFEGYSSKIEDCNAYCCSEGNCNGSSKTPRVALSVMVIGVLSAIFYK